MTDLDQFREQLADRVATERADLPVRSPDIDAIIRKGNRGRRRTRTAYGVAALVAASAVVAVTAAVLPGATPAGNDSVLPAGPTQEETASSAEEICAQVKQDPRIMGVDSIIEVVRHEQVTRGVLDQWLADRSEGTGPSTSLTDHPELPAEATTLTVCVFEDVIARNSTEPAHTEDKHGTRVFAVDGTTFVVDAIGDAERLAGQLDGLLDPDEVTHHVNRPPTPSGGHDYSNSRPEAPEPLSYDGEVAGLGIAAVPDYGDLPRSDDLKLGWLAVDGQGCAWFVDRAGQEHPLFGLEGSRVTPDGVSLRGEFGDVLVAPGDAIAGDGHFVDTAQGVLGDSGCAVTGRGFLAVPYPN